MTKEILAPRIGIDITYRQLAREERMLAVECSENASILQSGFQTAYTVDQAAKEIGWAKAHVRRADEFDRLADEHGEPTP